MTTWFAQNSGVNIDSVNQWNSAANGSGSWLTWASLGASDVLVANGKTSITINVPVTCGELTTIANGGTAGGGFIWPAGVAITANMKPGGATLLTASGSGTRIITGNLSGTNVGAYVIGSVTDLITIVGNVTGGSGSVGRTLNNCTNLVIIGTVTGGTNHADSPAINLDAGGTVVITGDVIAGTASPAIYNNAGTATVTVTGTIQTSATSVHAIRSAGGTLNLRHSGNQVSASNGTTPIAAETLVLLIDATATLTHTYRVNNSGSAGVVRSLYTGGTNLGQPATRDVRYNTVFGASSEYIGTCRIASPTLVAIGTLTDDTVGSYAPTGGLDASGVRSAIGLTTANLDTQLSGLSGRLPAALVGGRIAAELDSGLTADIADIKADSAAAAGYGADLVSKITSNVATALAKLYYMITGTGVDSKFTAKAVEDAPTGGVGSGGDWTDGEKSQIRYRLGIDGMATAPAEPDVDPIVITPATGIMTTGYLVTRVKGVATAGIKIYYQHVQEPTADRGSSYDDTIYSATSNSEGIAELSLVKGGLYYIWRTSSTRPKDIAAYRVVNADGTTPGSTLALPSHVGH